jgi:hypothetical protein
MDMNFVLLWKRSSLKGGSTVKSQAMLICRIGSGLFRTPLPYYGTRHASGILQPITTA